MIWAALLALLASSPGQAAPAPASAPARPEIAPVRVTTPPVIDGALEDEAWTQAVLPLTEWLTYNPLNGDHIAQTTEVRAVYDDRFLYFAFRCVDPEPDKVRSTLSRRDSMWNDDWVGLSLDSVGNGQSSYDLFVNPQGVQADVLTTPSAGENSAPDFVWDSAGRRTAEGYDVELRLPLTSFRFKSGDVVKMGILFWRRVSRLGVSVSWPEVPAGKSFIERHALMTLQNLKQPLTLEVIPTATWSLRQTRATPDAFSSVDSDPDAGISAKYGVTSAITVEGTVNPDFSQVESDSFQVEVNQRFPVFYPEKRPFFMEGMGTFELAGRRRRLEHAHRRPHARDRRPAVGRQVLRARPAGRPSRCWPRATRRPGSRRSASPRTRSWASARSTSSAAASGAWAARATRARS